jgi:membrane-associated phospholipid phosphatase
MTIVVLLVVAGTSGVLVNLAMRRWPAADPAAEASDAVRQALQHKRGKGLLRARLDPSAVTGLALTVASICVVVGGVVAGILFYLVRSRTGVPRVDSEVANWAAAHATGLSTTILRAVTLLGSTPVVIAVSLVVGAIEFRRLRSRSLWLFLTLAVGGEVLIVNLIKAGVMRARPAIDQLASFGGSSFPSGHTAAAAACYAALALVISRGRTPAIRAGLAGIAAGIAVGVGISRMLLGVHWFTDVVAGLAIGWAWFALCAIATGGRLLRFGNAADVAAPLPDRAVDDVTQSAIRGRSSTGPGSTDPR